MFGTKLVFTELHHFVTESVCIIIYNSVFLHTYMIISIGFLKIDVLSLLKA